MQDEAAARAAVLAAAQGMLTHGLSSGTSGNVSARLGAGHIVITPSQVPYPELGPADLLVLTLDGELAGPGRRGPGAVLGEPAAPGLLPGLPGDRGGAAQPSAVRHHVRGRPAAGAGRGR